MIGFLEIGIALFIWFLPELVTHAEQVNAVLMAACCVAIPVCCYFGWKAKASL